ncbi:MAG: hypothetical protein AAF211_27300 [Myxococcota bacterium]
MPRRNRQKWHRERRLAAEAAKARQRERQRRLEEQRAEARMRAEVALERTRSPVGRSRAEVAERNSIRGLLALASVDQSVMRRVMRLHEALWALTPGSVTCDDLPWLLLVARCPWVGAPETFRPPTRSVRRKREAMAAHLLTAYPVPPFLLRALDVEPLAVARVPEEDEWAVRILSHVGRGDSLRKIVGTRWLPPPLTRAMQHRFLSARADTSPILALRTAQVVGLGGPAAFARRLCRTRLQSLRGPDPEVGEGFWHRVIGWLAGHPDTHVLPLDDLDRILAWFEHRQRESLTQGTPMSFKGRTLRKVRQSTDDWWAHTERVSASRPFPPSGLVGLDDGPHTIREIRSYEALVEEGEIMHHCVASRLSPVRRDQIATLPRRISRS